MDDKPLKRKPPKDEQRYSDTTVRKQVEETPEVQEAIAELVESLGDEDTFAPKEGGVTVGRKAGVPLALVEERNEYIIGLWMMGLSPATIRQNVNKMHGAKGWGELAHERSIRRIISEHYQKTKPSVKDQRQYEEGLKEAVFVQQEQLAEKMVTYVRDREKAIPSNPSKEWKPFEFMAALGEIGRLRQSMIENRNWNASRMNPLIAVQNNSMQINVYEQNSLGVIEHEEKRKEVIALIDRYLDE